MKMSVLCVAALLLVLPVVRSGTNLAADTCNNDNRVIIEPNAQAMILGLFDMRGPVKGGVGCGQPDMVTMPAYEAAKWTLNRLNTANGQIDGIPVFGSYVPGVKIGMEVHDTCGNAKVATEKIISSFQNYYTPSRFCRRENTLNLGIIGASRSVVSQEIATWLGYFNGSQVSFSSASTALGDASSYPYFMRTTPASSVQAQVVADVLKKIGWTRISIVYTQDAATKEDYEQILSMASTHGICVTQALPIHRDMTETQRARILTKLAQDSTHGVVYAGAREEALQLMKSVKSVQGAGNLQWLFTGSISPDSEFVLMHEQRLRGFVSVSPESKISTEFRDYWTGLSELGTVQENPWYKEWFMTVNDCRLPAVTYEPYASKTSCPTPRTVAQKRAVYIQNQYVAGAIDAVVTFAKALKNAHADRCGGASGVCSSLQAMTTDEFFRSYLLKVKLSYSSEERIPSWSQGTAKRLGFDQTGEMNSPAYYVYNYNIEGGTPKFRMVGEYRNRQLQLSAKDIAMYNADRTSKLSPLPSFACPPAGCGICIRTKDEDKFIKINGDFIVNGIFSVHHGTAEKCGAISSHGAELAQAFIYGIQSAKKSLNILQGVDIGALGWDDCGVPSRGVSFIQKFEGGLLDVQSTAGDPYVPADVPAYIAAASDEVTIEVGKLLSRLRVPQVSYEATSSVLSDLNRYPYFMRTVPSDSKQADVIVKILLAMGWTYVQAVNSPDVYGRSGSKDFIQQAAANGICVTASYEFTTPDSFKDIVDNLVTRAAAKVVVVFARAEEYQQLFQAIKTANQQGKILVVGTSSWGSDNSVVNGLEDVARGSLTVGLKQSSLGQFSTYLAGLDVKTYTTNPWFRSWYQSVYQCYLDAKSMPMYQEACDTTKPITSSPNYKQGAYVLHMINAVYATAMGIHRTLEKVCGTGYTTVCEQFKKHTNRANLVVEEIEKASFTDMSSSNFQLNRREGNVDYEVYNYQTGGARRVGTYTTTTGSLNMPTNQIQYHSTTITSSCTSGAVCEICLQKLNKVLVIPGDLYIAGLFNIHATGDSVYTCGDVNKHNGYQYSEVFAYAIDHVNSGTAPVKLNGVKLGGVGFDDCSSGFQAANIVSSVYTGTTTVSKGGKTVQPNMIKAWMSYGDEGSMSVADELSKRQVPLISPSASSTELNDVAKYTTFFRTIPNDHFLTQGMTRLILALKWSCVQIVYSANAYGRAGYRVFRQNAKEQKLCVTQCLELETDGTYDEVLAKLKLSPTKVVVVIADVECVSKLLDAKQRTNANDLVLIGSAAWGNMKNVVRGNEAAAHRSFTFKVNSPHIQSFDAYLSTKLPGQYTRNPWFEKYYQRLFECDLPGKSKYNKPCPNPQSTSLVSSPLYEQENWVLSTLDAVYAVTQAIDSTLKEVCGKNYNGICPGFVASDMSEKIIGNLGKVHFTSARGTKYQFNSRSGGMGYDIYEYSTSSQYVKTGDTTGIDLAVNNLSALRQAYASTQAVCTPCDECKLDTELNTQEHFLYMPGDILLGGMFDVSSRGLFPFTCDKVRAQHSIQLVEAFAFAIEQVNSKQGLFGDKLRGVSLGGIAFDSCESAIRAGNLISDFHSGVITLVKNGEHMNPDKVKVYIGGMTTERSMQMADVLNELKLPQISYGAAGNGLHDRQKYPFFSRTIPANDKQVQGIVDFLKRHAIDSVQLINSPGPYGEDGSDAFMQVAKKNKICVSQNMTFKDNGTVTIQSATEVVNLLMNRPNSTVVVTFLDTAYINLFLRTLSYNKKAHGMFRFVTSSRWGKNVKVYRGAEKEVENTVTFNIDTGNVPGFDEYLANKFPNTYIRNPWFGSFYQEVYQCTLPGSTLKYPRPCATVDRSIVNSDYNQESYVMYVVDAVYSAAFGLDETLRELCGQNYTGICDEWRSSMESRKHLLNGIRAAKFHDSAVGSEFKFINDGESIRGYEIYALEKYSVPGSKLEYNLIGKYAHKTNLSLVLTVAGSYRFNHGSNCTYEESCEMCPYMTEKPSRYMKVPSSQDVNLVGFFGVHHTGRNYLVCGSLDQNHGFLRTLAFFYGLNLVNRNKYNDLHTSVKVGGLVFDTCHSTNRVRMDLYSFLDQDGLCHDASKADLVPPATVAAYITGRTQDSTAAAELLTPHHLTSLSPFMVAPYNTKARSPYLLRTLPACATQGSAVFDVLSKYEWRYFFTVYSDDECGLSAADTLHKEVEKAGFCMAKRYAMKSTADIKRAVAIIKELSNDQYGNVLVALTNSHHTRLLLRAVRDLKLTGRFTFVGVDGWGTNEDVVTDLEEVAAGSLTLKLPQYPVPGFVQWLTTMSNSNRLGLPEDWFHEFWQHTHKCHISTARVREFQYVTQCTMTESVTSDMIKDDDHVLQTIISTYVVAKGLTTAQSNPLCAGLSIDDCLASKKLGFRQLIYDAIKSVQFDVLPDELGNKSYELVFNDQNTARLGYKIYNFRKTGANYEYIHIGECSEKCDIKHPVTFHTKLGMESTAPVSECPQDDANCICIRTGNEPQVLRPPPGKTDQFTEIFGIVIIVLNLLGMLISFILFFHFICFYPVRGGTTVLGYIALVGVFLLFCFNFVYILHPCEIVCGVRRFCQGVIYSIIFGALAVKSMCTWKNTNIYDDFSVRSKQRLTHPCGVFIITLCFVAVQVIIATEWLIIEPPNYHFINYMGQHWPRCYPSDFYNQGLVLSLIYVMFLMFLTLGFSGFSWPNGENNFEARYILGSTVFCMGTWMVWCIVSTMTDVKYRDGATALGNIFCAYGLLIFIFFRKCFLLHKFRRNTRSRKLGGEHKADKNLYADVEGREDDQLSEASSGRGSL